MNKLTDFKYLAQQVMLMPDNFISPWYYFMTNSVNQMKFSAWTYDKAVDIEDSLTGYYSMILVFPLHVIATNRVLDTALRGTSNSFRPSSLWTDLVNLRRIGGFKTIFAGLVPTLIFYIGTKHTGEKNEINTKMDMVNNLSSKTTTARIALREHFGATKIKKGEDPK